MHGQAGVGPKLTSCHRCRKINLAVSACSAGLVCERIGRDARRPTVTSSLARVEAAASSRFGVCLLLSVVGAGGCLSVRGAVPLLVAGCGLAIFWRRQCGWWHANGEGVAAESGKWRRTAEAHSRPKTRVCALNFFSSGACWCCNSPTLQWRADAIRSQTSLSVSLAVEYFLRPESETTTCKSDSHQTSLPRCTTPQGAKMIVRTPNS